MVDRTEYWRRFVTAWEKCGLSQAEFRRRRSIEAVSFGWWKQKLLATGKKERPRICRGFGARRVTRRGEPHYLARGNSA